jgi:hypothetical protein
MEDENIERLPDDLLTLADRLELSITEAGEVTYLTSIGAGFQLEHWLVLCGGELFIEVTLSRQDDGSNPVGQMQMLVSDPIDYASAERVLKRWGALNQMSFNYDGDADMADEKNLRESVICDLFDRLKNTDK